MSYSSDICRALIQVTQKFSTLDPGQLAGHRANLTFWIQEVKHCLLVLDGYRKRFEQMRQAQDEFQHNRGYRHPNYGGFCSRAETNPLIPPRRGLKDSERKLLRRELLEAFERFLASLVREGLLNEEEAKVTAANLGMSIDFTGI